MDRRRTRGRGNELSVPREISDYVRDAVDRIEATLSKYGSGHNKDAKAEINAELRYLDAIGSDIETLSNISTWSVALYGQQDSARERYGGADRLISLIREACAMLKTCASQSEADALLVRQLADADVGRVDAGALGVKAGGDSGGGSVKNSRSRPYDASAEVSRHADDGSGDRTHDLSVRELLRLHRGRDRKWG
jgi:hypothetical protein